MAATQAAIQRMLNTDIGLGQTYTAHKKKRRGRASPKVGFPVEIRWRRPAHEGIEDNEQADAWANLAADDPDSHGVEL